MVHDFSFFGSTADVVIKKEHLLGFLPDLKKGNVVYIIFFIKVKASIELSIAAHFFIVI